MNFKLQTGLKKPGWRSAGATVIHNLKDVVVDEETYIRVMDRYLDRVEFDIYPKSSLFFSNPEKDKESMSAVIKRISIPVEWQVSRGGSQRWPVLIFDSKEQRELLND